MTFTPINLTLTVAKAPFILSQTSNGTISLPSTSSLAGSISLVGPSSLKGLEVFVAGQYQPDEIVIANIAPYAFTISLQNSVAQALTAATNQTIFTINKTVSGVTTQIGTITFAAGSADGVIALTDADIVKRDLLTVQAPTITDPSLADIVFILAE